MRSGTAGRARSDPTREQRRNRDQEGISAYFGKNPILEAAWKHYEYLDVVRPLHRHGTGNFE